MSELEEAVLLSSIEDDPANSTRSQRVQALMPREFN